MRSDSANQRPSGPRPKRRSSQVKSQADRSLIRLNKFLADCGVASRRGADELITEGHITVNGKKVYELGAKISPKTDHVAFDGKPVQTDIQKIYIAFYKPKGVLTTMDDPEGRPCVADYFSQITQRVFPIGRLDFDSEGLILLTNDGEFAQKVMHPKHEVFKTYLVKVNGQPKDEQINKLRSGVSIIGGRVNAPFIERVKRKGATQTSEKYDWFRMSISEGKNRQIRQMFFKIGFDVLKLQRVAIGRLKLGSLERGEWAYLTENEVERIFVPIKEQGFKETSFAKGPSSQRRPISGRRQRKAAPVSAKRLARNQASAKQGRRN